jgi:predicted nuclease of predicted toxin-antitoxin system
MKFLLDENVDARLKIHLTQFRHEVTRVGSDYPQGLSDRVVLSTARAEGRVLITNDRDFGELVFRLRQAHQGVILLRLGSYAPLATLIQRLDDVLARYSDELEHFLVVTPRTIRVRRQTPGPRQSRQTST